MSARITVEEIARRLGIGRQTVYTMLEQPINKQVDRSYKYLCPLKEV